MDTINARSPRRDPRQALEADAGRAAALSGRTWRAFASAAAVLWCLGAAGCTDKTLLGVGPKDGTGGGAGAAMGTETGAAAGMGAAGTGAGAAAGAAGDCANATYGDDYFPLVLGAEWEFTQRDSNNGIVTSKLWQIEEEVDGVYRFLQREDQAMRTTWTRRDDQGRLWWLRKSSFDDEARTVPTQDDQYESPGRLRLDPSRTMMDDKWTELTTIWILPMNENACKACVGWTADTPATDVCRDTCGVRHVVEDTWTVVPPDSDAVLNYGTDLLCHQRVEVDTSDDPDEPPTSDTKKFCFKRGVGKVWEWDMGTKIERLDRACFP